MFSKKNFSLVSFFVILVVSVFVLLNIRSISFAVIDWWSIRTYDPPAVIAQMVEDTGMSDKGQKIFYAGQPVLQTKSEFNSNCPINESTYVLGCYSARDIFLLDVDDPSLEPVESVTGAHEMLHGVWERHSQAKKDELSVLLVEAFENINDKRLNELIENYRQSSSNDTDVIPNELHSILATEIFELPEELEKYYSEYFIDRSKVVELFVSYESVFAEIQKNIDSLESEINTLRNKINSLESQIQSNKSELDELNSELQRLLSDNNVSEYNNKIPAQNRLVRSFNALIVEYNAAIVDHNKKVEKLNSLATQQNDLIKSIDSKFQ